MGTLLTVLAQKVRQPYLDTSWGILFVQTANGVGDAQQNTTVKCHHFRHAEYVLQAEGGKCLIGKGILF